MNSIPAQGSPNSPVRRVQDHPADAVRVIGMQHAVLKELEWNGTGYCQSCCGWRYREGHAPACPLAAALKAAEPFVALENTNG